MKNNLLIIQGHPDPDRGHFCHALADSYADAALGVGHAVERIDVARLTFPLLRTREDFEHGTPCADIQGAQRLLQQAGHVLILYPLWLGGMPALLKGFLEQVLRPGFAFGGDGGVSGRLQGRSARIVVTMGMPAPVYRWYFGAHGLKLLERSILGLCGIRPVGHHIIGSVEGRAAARLRWLERMRVLGMRGR